MSDHRIDVEIARSPAYIAAVLGVRPAAWLRSFLRLATVGHLAGGSARGDSRPPWYRLGAPMPDGGGGVTARFTCWPHLGGGVFETFRGEFRVTPHGTGAVLRLSGEARGGQPERNAAVLGRLVHLIGQAVSAL